MSKVIVAVYGSNGKEYKKEALKYGVKKGMFLKLLDDEFVECTGEEKVVYLPKRYDSLSQSNYGDDWCLE